MTASVKRIQGMTISQLMDDPPHSIGGVLRICEALREARGVLEDYNDPIETPEIQSLLTKWSESDSEADHLSGLRRHLENSW